MGPPELPALEAGGSGLAACCAFMVLLVAAGGWVLLPPRLPAFYRTRGKKERRGRRRFASGGGAQGPREAIMALPDRTGPGLKAVRTGFGGQVTRATGSAALVPFLV